MMEFEHLSAFSRVHPELAGQPGLAGSGVGCPGALRTLLALLGVLLAVAACGRGPAVEPEPPEAGQPPPFLMLRADPPSADEDYCAWYGRPHDGVLYFGQAAFWSSMWTAKDPRADLETPGPQLVGRVDLREGRMLDPFDVTEPGARSGVWDVLPRDDGKLFYTTFYETAGILDLETREVTHLDGLGPGLNELAPGPDGTALVTRYGGGDGGDGSVLVLESDGTLLAEHVLDPVQDHVVAPKSVAWDPVREEIWVNADLLPVAGGPFRYDARILGPDGRQRFRTASPEIQFVSFRPDGVGIVVEAQGEELWMRVLRPSDIGQMPGRGERLLLDNAFSAGADFAQDVHFEEGADRAVVMRWGGIFHVVDFSAAPSSVRSGALPRRPGDLYYSAAVHEGRLCATLCGGVTVVCTVPAP
jgi:hypothetical protein